MTLLDLVFIPGLVIYLPKLLQKKRGGWRERFGETAALPAKSKPRILLHGVSVGEVNALRALVPLLTQDHDVVVSVTTDTGMDRARALFASTCTVVRYPLDASWAVRKFLDAVQPDAVALCELELWPQFLRACTRRDIPVAVINGRLSPRSFRGYHRFKFALSGMFKSLAFAAVQDQEYAQRFIAMGVAPDCCHITGSMKWDAISLGATEDLRHKADELATQLGIDRSRPLIVAGSTGPGEEALLHQAVASLGPAVQLLCAPRKPERFSEAAAALPACTRRSDKRSAPAGSTRYLLDTIGELRTAYSLADIVVVGRSFGDQYGSDPIEPIALDKPVLIGPAVADFQTIVDTFDAAGGILRTTRDTLAADLKRLMDSPEVRTQLAERGISCIRTHQGASQRHAELLRTLVARKRA